MSVGRRILSACMTALVLLPPATAFAKGVAGRPKLPKADFDVVPDLPDDNKLYLQDFGPTVPASSLLGKSVVDRFDEPVGTVKDLFVDPRTAEFPLMLIEAQIHPMPPGPRIAREDVLGPPPAVHQGGRWEQQETRSVKLLFPSASLTLEADEQGRLVLEGDFADAIPLSFAGSSQTVTRHWLEDQASEREDLASWQEAEYLPERSDLVDKPQRAEDYRLLPFTELKGAKVTDGNFQPLGQIEDLAITVPHRRVPYAAVALTGQSDSQLFQVPLMAFVEEAGKPWILDDVAASEAARSRIDLEHWPARIDQTWQTYLGECYSKDPRDGVEVRRAGMLVAEDTVLHSKQLYENAPAAGDQENHSEVSAK
jgi:hypothetical protein